MAPGHAKYKRTAGFDNGQRMIVATDAWDAVTWLGLTAPTRAWSFEARSRMSSYAISTTANGAQPRIKATAPLSFREMARVSRF